MLQVTRGMLLGVLGVVAFSLTLPMTRWAVADLDAVWVVLARASGAAMLAAACLLVARASPPPRAVRRDALLAALGVVVGFPLFSTLAMTRVDASHGAIVIAVLPLATTAAGALVTGERPSRRFWMLSLAGAACLFAYLVRDLRGGLGAGDAALLAAVAAAAIGYAYGARVASRIGAWQSICWSLVGAAPLMLPLLLWRTGQVSFASVSDSAWIGFAYVTVFSQLVGFFFWYGGMALAGVARVSQTQLLQLFFTLAFAAWLNGERADPAGWVIGVLIVAIVGAARRAPIARVAAAVPVPRPLEPPR